MNLYESIKALFGPGKVFDLKDGDRGSDDLKDYCPIIMNVKNKYYNIPDDKIYDMVIDTILFYNDYSKKTTKRTNLATFFKMSMTQGAINYIGVKRNMMNATAISFEEMIEAGFQL